MGVIGSGWLTRFGVALVCILIATAAFAQTPEAQQPEAEEPSFEDEVTVVATTRTGRRVEDQPIRVEVVPQEEIDEKVFMTPGDVSMMLTETNGLRVQVTSPFSSSSGLTSRRHAVGA